MDFYGKLSRLTDFENTVDCGCAVIYDADSGLCLSYVRTMGPKQNLDHRSFFSLDWYVHEFIQTISFFERSLFKLRCETVIGIVLCCCHQTCPASLHLGKITVAFTCTSFPLNLNTSVFGCGCGFEFEQKFWRIEGFGEKKARIGGSLFR